MNPAPPVPNLEQLNYLIPTPLHDGSLPGAPSPIDCQSFPMRGIIRRRTALRDHISSLLDLAGYFPRFMGLKEVGYMALLAS